MEEVQLLPKESIGSIKFTKADVLLDDISKRLRSIYLKKAEALGNTYHGKVKMTMVSDSGQLYAVETTIWSVNEEYISLKAGVYIPTKAVLDIEF